MSYYPIDNHLIERRGDAVELLVLGEEMNSGSRVCVTESLSLQMARAIGNALIQCADAEAPDADLDVHLWRERCLDPIWSAGRSKQLILPSIAVNDGGRREPEVRFFIGSETAGADRKCSITLAEVLASRVLLLPKVSEDGRDLLISPDDRLRLIGGAMSAFNDVKPAAGKFLLLWIPAGPPAATHG